MENNLSKRKPTRLKKYDYSTVGAYFVTICTKDRAEILSSIIEPTSVGDGASTSRKGSFDVPQIKLSHIGKIVEKRLLSTNNMPDVKIDQYVIMPDHIHAIIIITNNEKNTDYGTSRAPSPTNAMLPHVISAFKRFCNLEIGENVFQRGYYDHIIRDKEDYDARRKYIYENSLRWYYKNRDKT